MTQRSKWIAAHTSCTQCGRSGYPVLSGAHLGPKAHSTVGKAPFNFYKVVYIEIQDNAIVICRMILAIFMRYVAVKADQRCLFAVTTLKWLFDV